MSPARSDNDQQCEEKGMSERSARRMLLQAEGEEKA